MTYLNKSKVNLIYDVVYKSNNESGNNYVILSKLSELPEKDSDLVLMKGVEATINIENSSPITIFSDRAIFNKATYDTDFSENVLIIYDDHYITSNNLDLFFQKNLAVISNEIIYKNLNIKKIHQRSIIAIGNFDGLHLGHQKVLNHIRCY